MELNFSLISLKRSAYPVSPAWNIVNDWLVETHPPHKLSLVSQGVLADQCCTGTKWKSELLIFIDSHHSNSFTFLMPCLFRSFLSPLGTKNILSGCNLWIAFREGISKWS